MSEPKYPPVNVDIKYLTPRELKTIMDTVGLSADDLDNPSAASGPEALAAMAWVITRREYPDVTLDEAWDIRVDLTGELDVDPTNASN